MTFRMMPTPTPEREPQKEQSADNSNDHPYNHWRMAGSSLLSTGASVGCTAYICRWIGVVAYFRSSVAIGGSAVEEAVVTVGLAMHTSHAYK